MPLFDYTGQLQSGRAFQGTLEADSREHAEAMLADMGVRVVSLRATKRFGYVAPLSLDDMLFFNEQVAALAQAEIPLETGLRRLAADVGSGKLKRLLLEIADDLQSGGSLEQAVERHRGRFPAQYADVVAAGLSTGDLGGVLHGLTTHLRLKSLTRRTISELAAYPLAILTLAFCVIAFLMRAVVPGFLDIFSDYAGTWDDWGATASSNTETIHSYVRILSGMIEVWPIFETIAIGLLAGTVLFIILSPIPPFRGLRDWVARHLPGIAQVYWSSVLARFTHTAALGAFSGTPMAKLISAAGASSGSRHLARTTQRVAERLDGGATWKQATADERDLPALWCFVVQVASDRGDIAAALEELARTYEARAQRWIATLRVLLGPILLIVVGSCLGLIIAAMMYTCTSFIRMLTS